MDLPKNRTDDGKQACSQCWYLVPFSNMHVVFFFNKKMWDVKIKLKQSILLFQKCFFI